MTGYAGGGGRELFDAPGTWEVPDQRIWLLADRALELLTGIPGEQEVRRSAREWVASRYTAKATLTALLDAVGVAFERSGAAAAATATHPFVIGDESSSVMISAFRRAFSTSELLRS